MAEVRLAADARRVMGSGESRRLRAVGKVPAVLYGHGVESQALVVDARDLRNALNQEAGVNALLSLEVESTRHLAMARQLQRHPVRRTVTHVDFVIVRRDEIVSVEVPVRLTGEALEVERADGVAEQQLFTLLVHAKPLDLPAHIDVDVSELTLGGSIRVGDLRLPPGVSTEVDPDDAVVVATAATAVPEPEMAEAEPEAGAGEAGEAAAPEGGRGEAERTER